MRCYIGISARKLTILLILFIVSTRCRFFGSTFGLLFIVCISHTNVWYPTNSKEYMKYQSRVAFVALSPQGMVHFEATAMNFFHMWTYIGTFNFKQTQTYSIMTYRDTTITRINRGWYTITFTLHFETHAYLSESECMCADGVATISSCYVSLTCLAGLFCKRDLILCRHTHTWASLNACVLMWSQRSALAGSLWN